MDYRGRDNPDEVDGSAVSKAKEVSERPTLFKAELMNNEQVDATLRSTRVLTDEETQLTM